MWSGVVVALLLLLAACGGGGDSEDSGGGDSGASGETFKLGFICSCSGFAAGSFGKAEETAKAWESWINDQGGINGSPVEVITKDDGGDPAAALRAVRELVEQDKVVAIVGAVSLVTDSFAKYVSDKGIPVVGGSSIETAYVTNPDYFPSGASNPVGIAGNLTSMADEGFTSTGVMYCAEAAICASVVDLSEAAVSAIGADMTVTGVKVAGTSPNYNSQCLALQDAGVQGVFIAATTEVVPKVATNCADLGYTPVIYENVVSAGPSWFTTPELDGLALVSPNAMYTDSSVPGVKTMVDALDEYAPDVTSSPQFTEALVQVWAGGQLFAAAAEAGKLTPTSTPDDIKAGLYALKDETLDGLAPPLTFTEGEPSFVSCYFVGELTGGEIVTPEAEADKSKCLEPSAAENCTGHSRRVATAARRLRRAPGVRRARACRAPLARMNVVARSSSRQRRSAGSASFLRVTSPSSRGV
jgi:branched-chain amino acid transport system substrate-binding protein